VCSICAARTTEYIPEHKAKSAALQKFWKAAGLASPLDPLVASPLGRNYRVVTKRKVFVSSGRTQLALIGIDEEGAGLSPVAVDRCVIEPEGHASIYRLVQAQLEKREYQEFGQLMNYVVIKGSYEEFTVILNLAAFNPAIRQHVNRLSKQLTREIKSIIGIFIVVDERRSNYYMPQRQEGRKLQYQKIFGKGDIFQKIAGKKFLFSPLSFSQTNLSMMEVFVAAISDSLKLNSSDHLLDLYSGYGIFSLSLAGKVRKATGIEISYDAVHDAAENARRQSAANCTYIASDINADSLERVFSSQRGISAVILDPPRNGTKPDVIEIIAAKNVSRAVHIFCNIELLPAELQRWSESGYSIAKAIPFDMFPGTSEVEVMVLLEKRS